jgi:bifunctional DNase/RNase
MVVMPPPNAITHTPVTSPETARLFLLKMAMGWPQKWGVMLAADAGDWFLRLPVESMDFGPAFFAQEWERFGMLTLTLRLLETTGGAVEAVELLPLETGVPIAVLTVRANGKTAPVEARPTDALVLAAKQNLPIVVTPPLMVREGWHIPDPEAIVARILAKDVDEPFLARVTDDLLQGMTRWRESDGEHALEPREEAVWNSVTPFQKDGTPHTIIFNRFSVYLPPDALPAVVARVKRLAGLDPTITDVEQAGAMTVDHESGPVTVRVRTIPGPLGETLALRCKPAPKPEAPPHQPGVDSRGYPA